MNIAREYLMRHDQPLAAAVEFARDLMKGDPATFKAGYSLENAAIAASEIFELSRDEIEDHLKGA